MRKRIRRMLFSVFGLAAMYWAIFAVFQANTPPLIAGPVGVFYVLPYLQAGDQGALPKAGETDSVSLLWQTADDETAEGWEVEARLDEADPWTKTKPPTSNRLAVDGLPPYQLFRAVIEGLKPGLPFQYRLTRKGEVEFKAASQARKAEGTPHKFVVFGDSGAGSSEQMPVAYRVSLEKPDYAIITGDIVYARGRISEYLTNHFPIYNNEKASPTTGAPLIRSTVFLAAPGNHDLVDRSLDRLPDGLAYFYYWDPPKNGPFKTPGAPQSAKLQEATDARKAAFLEAAKLTYPQTGNFAYDYADAHWTVIDSNPYADWKDPSLQAWLEADLAAAQGKPWRFVAFHHPGFNSSKAHFEDQRMRILAPLFEKHKVDIVFNGHVHNYQRTHPLRFAPEPVKDSDLVNGEFKIDSAFDGQAKTRPDGVLYVITGAGGARLYDPGQTDDQASWQPFTAKFVANIHSFTVVDLTANSATVRQVSDEGKELDRFVVTH